MFKEIFFWIFVNAVFADQLPIVTIPLGTIEGSIKNSVGGLNFYSFKGIPYAKPPVGKYRFKEPTPPNPWIGQWKANTSYTCIQYSPIFTSGKSKVQGEEDCLYLNIHTPTLNIDANLDVLIYIHGGAFMFNHGDIQGPELLMDRNVVHASMNYRLGPMGFLSTENDIIPGNNGLKDQILALQFIKDNIKYFGGNPNSITISGMSAGGSSVHLHFLMSKSKGLFHKGISQSGVALNPWVLMENPLEQTKKLASHVGCPTDNLPKLVKCLRQRPDRQIVDAVQYFQPWLYNPFSPFAVVIDSWSSNPLIPEHPLLLIQQGKVEDLPWISSYVQAEGLCPASDFYKDDYINYINKNWLGVMPHILHYNFTVKSEDLNNVSSEIRTYYLGDESLSKINFLKLVELIGDRLFLVDLEKCLKLQSAVMKSPIYSYKFNYRGNSSASDFKTGTKDNLGVSHTDATAYVFKSRINTITTPEDRKMTNVMLDIFVSFMKTGKPEIPGVQWTPIERNSKYLQQLHIKDSNNIKMESVKFIGHSDFWASLPFEENEKIINIKRFF